MPKSCRSFIETFLIHHAEIVPLICYAMQDAVEAVGLIATDINETVRARQDTAAVAAIGEKERLPDLCRPGRRLLHDGVLAKLCRRGFKDFRFYAFSDALLYCGGTPGRVIGKGKNTTTLPGTLSHRFIAMNELLVRYASIRHKRTRWIRGHELRAGITPVMMHGLTFLCGMISVGFICGMMYVGFVCSAAPPEYDHAILLESPSKSFVVKADSAKAVAKWQAVLEAAVRDAGGGKRSHCHHSHMRLNA